MVAYYLAKRNRNRNRNKGRKLLILAILTITIISTIMRERTVKGYYHNIDYNLINDLYISN